MKKYVEKELKKLNRAQLIELLTANEVNYSEDAKNADLVELLLAIEIPDEENQEVQPEVQPEQEEPQTENESPAEAQSDKSDKISALIAERRAKANGHVEGAMSSIAKAIEARRAKAGAVSTGSVKDEIERRRNAFKK